MLIVRNFCFMSCKHCFLPHTACAREETVCIFSTRPRRSVNTAVRSPRVCSSPEPLHPGTYPSDWFAPFYYLTLPLSTTARVSFPPYFTAWGTDLWSLTADLASKAGGKDHLDYLSLLQAGSRRVLSWILLYTSPSPAATPAIPHHFPVRASGFPNFTPEY